MADTHFEELIAPLSIEDFVSDYWQRELYLVRDRPTSLFGHLAPPAAIEELVASLPLPADSWLSIIDQRPIPIGDALRGPDDTIDLPSLYRVYESGRTLLLRRLHRRRRSIGLLCRSVEQRLIEAGLLLGDRVGANLYMTPPLSRGFEVHADDHDALIIQLSGSKVWRIYARTNAPRAVAGEVERDALPELRAETTLSAGDVLYLPAGFPHEALTDERESVHLTLSLRFATIRDVLIALTDHWTGVWCALPPRRAQAEAITQIACVLRSLAAEVESGEIMGKAIGDLEEQLVRRMAVIPDEGLPPVGRQLSRLDADCVVEVRPGVFGMWRHGSEAEVILLPGRRMEFPAALGPALEAIFSRRRLRIGDLPQLSEDDQRKVARELILGGVLRVATHEAGECGSDVAVSSDEHPGQTEPGSPGPKIENLRPG